MTSLVYTKGITAEDLRLLLGFWPILSAEAEETQKLVVEDAEKIFFDGTHFSAWCHLYELPTKDHIVLATHGIAQGFSNFLPGEQILQWYKQLADAPNQVGHLPKVIGQVGDHFNELATGISEEQVELTRPHLSNNLGLGLSLLNTLRCVLFHGCFLNELIERVRAGDDKALFDAIRIDSTVVGCVSVSNRVSKAMLLRDNRFFAKLKAAVGGKLTKREQANFQKMRLVFEVLHEAGASRLDDLQLHQLFVEELKLYTGNKAGGGSKKSLRKFADTYMK